MISVEDILQKERELRSSAWYLPAGFDTAKNVMFSAADLLGRIAAQQGHEDRPATAPVDGGKSE